MQEHTIAVKTLINHTYATGDLASQSRMKQARQTGQRLHAIRQNTYHDDDQKEVLIERAFTVNDHHITLSGRIDGVLKRNGNIIIEEIKSTETPLENLDETTYPAHMMQAKVYAALFALNHDVESMTVWLTYMAVNQEGITKTIEKHFQRDELVHATMQAIEDYLTWLTVYENHLYERSHTLEGLTFPFEHYREGQYHFMGAIYQTLIQEDILYATAPTGIGKTVGALFSALKTIKSANEKVFYLTAKNAGKTIAVETVERLKKHGLKVKALTLNSKENMCLMDEVDCDPEICPYAKGYYNRLRNALEDIFVHQDVLDATLMKQYGEYHTICPHEFALDIATYSDIVICDFNYVFDPRIQLVRFFEESHYAIKLLVDEAHNLVDRSRAMYSAAISLNDLAILKAETDEIKPSPKKAINAVIEHMQTLNTMHEVDKAKHAVFEDVDETLIQRVHTLIMKLDSLLERHKKHKQRKAVRNGYFLLTTFMRIYEYVDEAHRFIIEKDGEDTVFTLLCLDASKPLHETIKTSVKGTVFFSATLRPYDYFKTLITEGEGKTFSVPSPFNPSRLGLYCDVSTSTKYRDRPSSITRIIDTIYAMLETKKGNYIVFFPAYAYMQTVLEQFDQSGYDVMVQDRGMSFFERETFIASFKTVGNKSKILFSVLGGSFSEGVDYIGDALSGVLIVGVALPAFTMRNELLKDYYFKQHLQGFDYAYTIPGMHKVIQAVGRVIRTEDDYGIAILLDTRYNLPTYQALMPVHWQPTTLEETDYIQGFLKQFWNRMKQETE